MSSLVNWCKACKTYHLTGFGHTCPPAWGVCDPQQPGEWETVRAETASAAAERYCEIANREEGNVFPEGLHDIQVKSPDGTVEEFRVDVERVYQYSSRSLGKRVSHIEDGVEFWVEAEAEAVPHG